MVSRCVLLFGCSIFVSKESFTTQAMSHDSSEGIEGYYRQGNNVGKIKEGKPLDAKLSGLKNEK